MLSKVRTTTIKEPVMTTPIHAVLTTRHNFSIALLILLPFAAMAQEDEPGFTDDFPVEECAFTPFGGNEFFSLMPGRRTYFDNSACVAAGECEDREDLVITVTRDLKKVWIDDDGERRPIWTRVITEHERENGQIKEISRKAGNFDDCIEVTETTPLEPGSESMKVYCPDAGLVIDNDLEAIAVQR
jgi:hypothetical protein